MEFRDKPMQNLVRIPEKDICKNAQKLLLDGETVVGATRRCGIRWFLPRTASSWWICRA